MHVCALKVTKNSDMTTRVAVSSTMCVLMKMKSYKKKNTMKKKNLSFVLQRVSSSQIIHNFWQRINHRNHNPLIIAVIITFFVLFYSICMFDGVFHISLVHVVLSLFNVEWKSHLNFSRSVFRLISSFFFFFYLFLCITYLFFLQWVFNSNADK